MAMLVALDWFFLLFHTTLVLFNMIGWAWRRTRRIHLITMGVTLASWLLMGWWYGIGYCICTDWHWQVRQALGQDMGSQSYIQFLVERLTGWQPPAKLTYTVSAFGFALSALLSLTLNYRDSRKQSS